ncbi:MAG TPA: TetR/AcrR family transcriptional regulator [Candidatus Baltobacteraceae bacterium]|nr:TetR/AcrR family transcriptional regulator [Candidatus Baltobacteraceae bacterium]
MDPGAELRARDALLDRIRRYADEHGLYALTLENLAAVLAMPLDALEEFFGSKEDLIVALVARNRIRLREKFANLDSSAPSDEFRRVMWAYYLETAADSRLFFEAYGLALHDEHYAEFLHGINDWIGLLKEALERRGVARDRAEAFATLSLAVFRGAMLDYCATNERARVNAAMELWFKAANWLTEP